MVLRIRLTVAEPVGARFPQRFIGLEAGAGFVLDAPAWWS